MINNGVDLSKGAIEKFFKKYGGKKIIAQFEKSWRGVKDELFVIMMCPGISPKNLYSIRKDSYFLALNDMLKESCMVEEEEEKTLTENSFVYYPNTLFIYRCNINKYEIFKRKLKDIGVEVEIANHISNEEIDEDDDDEAESAYDLVEWFSDSGLKILGFNPSKIKALAKKKK